VEQEALDQGCARQLRKVFFDRKMNHFRMLEITNTCRAWYRTKRLEYLLTRTLHYTESRTPHIMISLVFARPNVIKKMNSHFRKKDTPTNVLTFVLEKTTHSVQAEIVLCSDVIKKEARMLGIPYSWHLERLWVHGLLHVVGYRHDTEKEAQVMELCEQNILKRDIKIKHIL